MTGKQTPPHGYKLVEVLRPDGETASFFEPEDAASGVDLSALDEPRSVAEGDADAAELMELLGGLGKADAVRRAVRFTLEQKKKGGK